MCPSSARVPNPVSPSLKLSAAGGRVPRPEVGTFLSGIPGEGVSCAGVPPETSGTSLLHSLSPGGRRAQSGVWAFRFLRCRGYIRRALLLLRAKALRCRRGCGTHLAPNLRALPCRCGPPLISVGVVLNLPLDLEPLLGQKFTVGLGVWA